MPEICKLEIDREAAVLMVALFAHINYFKSVGADSLQDISKTLSDSFEIDEGELWDYCNSISMKNLLIDKLNNIYTPEIYINV